MRPGVTVESVDELIASLQRLRAKRNWRNDSADGEQQTYRFRHGGDSRVLSAD